MKRQLWVLSLFVLVSSAFGSVVDCWDFNGSDSLVTVGSKGLIIEHFGTAISEGYEGDGLQFSGDSSYSQFSLAGGVRRDVISIEMMLYIPDSLNYSLILGSGEVAPLFGIIYSGEEPGLVPDALYFIAGEDDLNHAHTLNFPRNQWFQLGCSWNGNIEKIFIDGRLESKVRSGGNMTLADSLYLGASPEFGYSFRGSLDNLVIYDSNVDFGTANDSSSAKFEIPDINETEDYEFSISLQGNMETPISSFELRASGFDTNLVYLGCNLDSVMFSGLNWSLSRHYSDGLLYVAAAGADSIIDSGTLMNITAIVPESNVKDTLILTVDWIIANNDTLAVNVPGRIIIHPVCIGDADLNGQIRAYDASQILKYEIGRKGLNRLQKINADINEDSVVSAFDAALILQYLVGIIDSLPCDTSIAGEGSLSFNEGQQTLSNQLEVPLTLTTNSDLYSLYYRLSYDPSQLQCLGVERAEGLDGLTLENDIRNGEIIVSGASGTPMNGNLLFSKLIFAPADGQTELESSIILEETQFNDMPREIAGDTLTVQMTVTGVADTKAENFRLEQNYPNPFNPLTHIRYTLPEQANLRMAIFDVSGRLVRSWARTGQMQGQYDLVWDGRNDHGKILSAGIYFCRMEADPASGSPFVQTRKMVFLK